MTDSKIDSDALWNEYQTAQRNAEVLGKSGSDQWEKKENSIAEITRLSEEIDDTRKRLEDLKIQLGKLEDNKGKEHDLELKLTTKIDNIMADFETAKQHRDQTRENYVEYFRKLPAGTIESIASADPTGMPDFLDVHILGDLHGWAPGYINWLSARELAKVSINGYDVNPNSDAGRKAMEHHFPNPMQLIHDKGIFPLPPHIDGNPLHPEGFPPSIFRNISAEWTGSEGQLFVHIGDYIDRGDHSEICLELTRQLVSKSRGMAWALIGNHEEMVLNGAFDNWLGNEERHILEPPHAGSIRHMDAIYHEFEAGEKAASRAVFTDIQSHLAHLCLTQELMIRKSLDKTSLVRWCKQTDEALRLGGYNPEKLEEILSLPGWAPLEASHRWLNNLIEEYRTNPESSPCSLPGAIVAMGIGQLIFTHAEVSAFTSLDDGLMADFSEHYTLKSGASIHLLAHRFHPKQKTATAPLMWQRKGIQGKSLTKLGIEGLQRLSAAIPSMRWHIHGHTPLKQKTTTILHVEPDGPRLLVSNIDEGMTPAFRSDAGYSDAYDCHRIPSGLQHQVVKESKLKDRPEDGSDLAGANWGEGPGLKVFLGNKPPCPINFTRLGASTLDVVLPEFPPFPTNGVIRFKYEEKKCEIEVSLSSKGYILRPKTTRGFGFAVIENQTKKRFKINSTIPFPSNKKPHAIVITKKKWGGLGGEIVLPMIVIALNEWSGNIEKLVFEEDEVKDVAPSNGGDKLKDKVDEQAKERSPKTSDTPAPSGYGKSKKVSNEATSGDKTSNEVESVSAPSKVNSSKSLEDDFSKSDLKFEGWFDGFSESIGLKHKKKDDLLKACLKMKDDELRLVFLSSWLAEHNGGDDS